MTLLWVTAASAGPLDIVAGPTVTPVLGGLVSAGDAGSLADPSRGPKQSVGRPAAPVAPLLTITVTTGGERARAADALASTLGVNVKTSENNGTWGEHAKIQAALQRLGVRHLRTRLFTNRPDQYAVLRNLAAAGIRSDVVAGDPTGSGGTPEQLVAVAAGQLGTAVDAFEGVNEWNFSGHANWAAEARAHQQRLYRAVNANPRTASVPVLGPAISANASSQRSILGDLSPYLDYGNNHLYPGGRAPSWRIDEQLLSARIVSGRKPVMFTEAGYHNALNDSSGHRPTSEGATAVYGPKLLAEHFSRGVSRVYLYDMVDDQLNASLNNHEDHLGLLHNDLSEKPVFGALRNLLRLTSDPGAGFTPGSLKYSLVGAPADLRHILLQKRDGKFLLLLWRDVTIWDQVREVSVPVTAATMGVHLARSSPVSVFRPSSSAAAQASLQTSAPSVKVGGDLVVMQIG